MVRGLLLAAALSATLAACATPESTQAWPATVVSVDQMQLLAPLRMRFITKYGQKGGLKTVVLVVHVNTEGKPVRSRIEQSSGHPQMDEAAKLSLQDARFIPYRVDGVAQEVSVVMPMHVPVKER